MNFKEWLNLNETITFSIPEYEEEQSATHLSALAWKIQTKLLDTFNIDGIELDMDGLDVDAVFGTLNLYIKKEVPKNLINIKKAVIYYIKEFGWEFMPPEVQNQSQMFKVPTIRFNVKKANKHIQPLSLNMTNTNADDFLVLLGYSRREIDQIINTAKINVRDLNIKLGSLTDYHLQSLVKSGTARTGENGSKFISMERTLEQVKKYVETLHSLIYLASKEHIDHLNVS